MKGKKKDDLIFSSAANVTLTRMWGRGCEPQLKLLKSLTGFGLPPDSAKEGILYGRRTR